MCLDDNIIMENLMGPNCVKVLEEMLGDVNKSFNAVSIA